MNRAKLSPPPPHTIGSENVHPAVRQREEAFPSAAGMLSIFTVNSLAFAADLSPLGFTRTAPGA